MFLTLSLRQVGGGWLAQNSDDLTHKDISFNVVSDKNPTESELDDANFAWLCVKHVKSNAIVIAKNNCMLGMGSGQPNRVESLRIAFRKAGEEAKGAALASDVFFPFAWKDAVEEACEKGIGVIAEPGGSREIKTPLIAATSMESLCSSLMLDISDIRYRNDVKEISSI